MHTCHISHCEIKSHRIQPIWKLIPRRIFKSHRISRSIYKRFYEKVNINHTIVSIRSLLKLNKGFKIPLGSLKANFVQVPLNCIKSHLKFSLISQISVYNLWHACKCSCYASKQNILPKNSSKQQSVNCYIYVKETQLCDRAVAVIWIYICTNYDDCSCCDL